MKMAQTKATLLLLMVLPLTLGQLASFDQLRNAFLGSHKSQKSMEQREDRSLTNSYPFNQVAQQSSHDRATHHQAPVGAVHHQAAQPHAVHHQAAPQRAAYHQPASVQRLGYQEQSSNPGFSLLSGFGSRTSSRNPFQIGAIGQSHHQLGGVSNQVVPAFYQRAPANYQTSQGYYQPGIAAPQPHNRAPLPTFLNSASSGCPIVEGLPLSQCRGAASQCWARGQSDVDCPNHGLCCFDGCANICISGSSAPVPAPVPVHAPVHIPAPAPFVDHVVVEAPKPVRRLSVPNPAFQSRQPLPATTFGAVAAAGKRCIDKVETVEEIEYEEVEECNHSYDKQCHTTYVTEYESQQEEECEDNYKKSCDITYSPQAQNLTVAVCMRPLIKDCNIAGPEICRTEYVSECWTRNEPHLVEDDVPSCRTVQEEKCVETQTGYTTEQDCKKWPREVCTISRERKAKYNPVTKCEKVPQQLCGPSGCGFVQGPEICHDEVKTVVTDIPEENCDLQPRRTCEHVTKLVPKLSPVEECVDVPKEVCTKGKVNPRKVHKPVTKKWCYIPSEESGLA